MRATPISKEAVPSSARQLPLHKVQTLLQVPLHMGLTETPVAHKTLEPPQLPSGVVGVQATPAASPTTPRWCPSTRTPPPCTSSSPCRTLRRVPASSASSGWTLLRTSLSPLLAPPQVYPPPPSFLDKFQSSFVWPSVLSRPALLLSYPHLRTSR